MRGQILEADTAAVSGLVLGSDGNRYTFERSNWKSPVPPAAGLEIDFVPGDMVAQEIYVLPGAASATNAPQRQPVSEEGASVMLGLIGIGCLALGFIVPVLPTIAAFVLGLIGADSAKRHNNATGLLFSRIAWIGAIILFAVAIVLIVLAVSFAWPFFGMMMDYVHEAIREEMGQRALLRL